MANEKRKKLTPVQQEYHLFEKERETKRPIVRNCVCAFLVGGIICVIGQAISYFYMYFF
ncbi:Stage V sporulation protein AC [Geobacillus sp. WSUCF1]|nr:Stage V sporulation protein AC [Geobacillus sp. WSUCF1]